MTLARARNDATSASDSADTSPKSKLNRFKAAAANVAAPTDTPAMSAAQAVAALTETVSI